MSYRARFVDAAEVTPDISVTQHIPVGDGVTDYTTRIQAAVALAGDIVLDGGRYPLSGTITVPSNTKITCAPGTVIYGTAVPTFGAYFWTSGTNGTKTNLGVDAVEGAVTVTLPTGTAATYTPGSVIGFESSTIVAGTDGRARELHKVISVASDVVSLDSALAYGYTVAAGAQFWKMTPIENVEFENLIFESSNPTVNTGYAIRVNRGVGTKITNVTLHNMSGGVVAYDQMDMTVNGLVVDRLPNYGNAYGYGFVAGSSTTNLVINGLIGRGCRHLFTTLADERTSPSTWWGGPINVTINGAIGIGNDQSLTIFDSHEYGRNILFNNCVAVGGGTACTHYQMRAKYTGLNKCVSYRAGLRGVAVAVNADYTHIDGGDFSYAVSNGISVASANTNVLGARIHHNGSSGVVVSAADGRIQGCKIHDNGPTGTSGRGVECSAGSNRLTIADNEIPYSVAQDLGILNALSDAVITGNVLLGYPTSTSALFGINAQTRTHGNITNETSYPIVRSGIGQRRETYGSVAPTTGTWAIGDICWNTVPAAATNMGWTCTTAGTPGTWKTFGAVAA